MALAVAALPTATRRFRTLFRREECRAGGCQQQRQTQNFPDDHHEYSLKGGEKVTGSRGLRTRPLPAIPLDWSEWHFPCQRSSTMTAPSLPAYRICPVSAAQSARQLIFRQPGNNPFKIHDNSARWPNPDGFRGGLWILARQTDCSQTSAPIGRTVLFHGDTPGRRYWTPGAARFHHHPYRTPP
jgi:hypothetical protein